MAYVPVQIVITRTPEGKFKITTFDREKVVNEAFFVLEHSVLKVVEEELPDLACP